MGAGVPPNPDPKHGSSVEEHKELTTRAEDRLQRAIAAGNVFQQRNPSEAARDKYREEIAWPQAKRDYLTELYREMAAAYGPKILAAAADRLKLPTPLEQVDLVLGTIHRLDRTGMPDDQDAFIHALVATAAEVADEIQAQRDQLWDQLAQMYMPSVRFTQARLAGYPTIEAESVVGDVLCAIFVRLRSGAFIQAPLEAYCLVALRYAIAGRKKRLVTQPQTAESEGAFLAVPDVGYDQVVAVGWIKALFESAGLDPRDQRIIALWLDGWNFVKIGKKIGLSTSTVSDRYKKALARMRVFLEGPGRVG